VDALSHFAARSNHRELLSIAADFLENGPIGRLDWTRNWPQFKTKHPDQDGKSGVQAVIADWLTQAGYDADPAEVERTIDQMLIRTPGQYR